MRAVVKFILSVGLLCYGCGGQNNRTIPLDKMAIIVADIDLAEKMVREFPMAQRDSMRQLLEKSLLKVHSVSQEELDINLYLYQSDYEIYEKLLNKMSENYDAKS
jgi:hypothetical protein